MSDRPVLVYADAAGNIYDWPELEMVGSSGGRWQRLSHQDWIPLPEGSELFLLPERLPAGYNPSKKRFEVLYADPYDHRKKVRAVAAFVAPAHTQLYSPAYRTLPKAPLLPLFAYTAVGWHEGQFVATAVRIDADDRQDFSNFNPEVIERNTRKILSETRHNRLLQHLGKCALGYGCPAARNLFMNRWEAPLPASPSCNARCLGCISQQSTQDLCANQERIRFVPTPQEIAEVAVPHLQTAPRAIVSFGQGCEGEPLLQSRILKEAILLMRQATSRGTINLNTNGSHPGRIKKLSKAGLDSMRVSLNSSRPHYYHAYYRPIDYDFEDVKASIRLMKAEGKFVSLNYFVLPGFTDERDEWSALVKLIKETGIDLIQMRNFNIDPEWIMRGLGKKAPAEIMGVRKMIERLRDEFPHLRIGYFNPPLDEGTI